MKKASTSLHWFVSERQNPISVLIGFFLGLIIWTISTLILEKLTSHKFYLSWEFLILISFGFLFFKYSTFLKRRNFISCSSPELFRMGKKKAKAETWSMVIQKKTQTSGKLRHELTPVQVLYGNYLSVFILTNGVIQW